MIPMAAEMRKTGIDVVGNMPWGKTLFTTPVVYVYLDRASHCILNRRLGFGTAVETTAVTG
jgi:hypothetical protein